MHENCCSEETPPTVALKSIKDPEMVRKQLRGQLNLQMKDLRGEDLMDDINTDARAYSRAALPARTTGSR